MILCFLFKMKIATLAFMKSCSTVRLIIRTIYLSANWAKQCLLTTLKRFINKNLLASIGDGQLDYLYSRDGGAQRVLHARIAYDCGHSTNPRTHLPLGTLRSHWYIYFFLHLYTIRVAFTLLRCWCWLAWGVHDWHRRAGSRDGRDTYAQRGPRVQVDVAVHRALHSLRRARRLVPATAPQRQLRQICQVMGLMALADQRYTFPYVYTSTVHACT